MHGAGYLKSVRVEAFQQGDMDAIAEAVDAVLPWLWRLTGRGFLTQDDGVPVWVQGIEDADEAVDVIEHLVAGCLGPEDRPRLDGAGALQLAVLRASRETLLRHARRAGTLVDVQSDEARQAVPEGVEDLDAQITSGQRPSDAAVTASVERTQLAEALRIIKDDYVGGLDERSMQLVHERFVLGRSREEIAKGFDCGVAAVAEREMRVRRKLGHAIRRVHHHLDLGPASLDAVLSDRLVDPSLHPVTQERLRTQILRRIHIDVPRSFGARAAWAAAVAAVAFGLWLLMYLGVLPYYDDDTYPVPGVTAACASPCAAGSEVRFEVTAPQDATEVALAFVGADGKTAPLLVTPAGTSLRVPFGSRVKSMPIAYAAKAPGGAGTVTAVFSTQRLNEAQILGVVNRTATIEGTLTATTALPSTGSPG
ncbi:MAG: hypothetical protein RIT81_31310 [Deltaproteobacteria bacterium]